MATHLLDDVQQVCDHVVMIDAGRLVVAGATDSLLERTGIVTVDVGPRGAELVAALRHGRPLDGDRRGRRRRGDGRRRRRPRHAARRHRRPRAAAVPAVDPAHVARRSVPAPRRGRGREHRSTAGAGGAVYDRGYRPYDGRAGPAGRGDVRAVQGVDAPRARHPAVVAPEGRAVRAARHRHDPRDRQRRHRLRDARPVHLPTDRDHHLPRLRRRVVGAVAVRRAGRARRHVPRPPPARAAADVRPAAHRRRLRRREGRRDRARSCSRSRSCRRSCCSSATCS